MGLAVDIYGSLINLPDKPSFIEVEDWGEQNISEQYWRRKELPAFFDYVEYDKQGNLLLTIQQEEYAREEVRRCKEGFYFLNNGILTYITGKHYFYLQWWKLEDDIYPDYRDTDRRYFIFMNFWETVLWCIFIFRGKKRREGASSQASSNLMHECIFFRNSFCGLVSKTLQDSRDTFTDMVAFGYRQLPVFLQPKQLNDKDSVSELVFAHKSANVKGGKTLTIDNDAGHRSRVNYRAPVENAYDRGRVSRALFDEGGKWPREVPFSKFIAKVSKTMVKGAKRVGFAECPSTVNEMTKAGGAEFKIVWDNANQFKSNGKPTPNQGVRYFSPAFDGFEGFIDKHGMSVIGEPTHEQYQYLVDKWVGKSALTEEDIKLGAKAYLLKKREGLKGDLLEEEIRQNPFDEDEMFMAANTGCVFNSFNINAQVKYLEEAEIPLRQVSFYRKEENTIAWKDDKQGFWKILALPPTGQENKYRYDMKLKMPERTKDGIISIDGYTNTQGGRYGSKAGAYIIRKFDILDPENTGMPVAQFYGRPSEKGILHEQIMMACEFYGYKSCWEFVADEYYTYFRERGKFGYLMRCPRSAVDPSKRKDADVLPVGYPTTPFALTKALDEGVSYFEHSTHKIFFIELLQQALLFDPNDRTKSDLVVAFINGLVCAAEPEYKPKAQKEPLIRTFKRSLQST